MNVDRLIKNLESLANALDHLSGGSVRGTGGLRSASSKLRSQRTLKGKEIRIDVPNLLFNVPKNRHQHLKPKKSDFESVKLSITLIFEGGNLSIETIKNMNVDIVLIGKYEERQVTNAWHFDFHAIQGNETFTHPMFHCQNGGRNLRESPNEANKDIETGDVLLIESPRLVHPPLDPVLAVEFVFGNFLGSADLQELHKNREFKSALSHSMESIWRPYYKTMMGFFDVPSDLNNQMLASKLNPTLCK